MARKPRTVTVNDMKPLTPNMTRLTLGGDALSDFPAGFEGGYVKLVLADDDGQSRVRSFTVRALHEAPPELVLDMVAHAGEGPAADWLERTRPGDEVTINGPGACPRVNPDADWFVLAGDMSALPAISVNLQTLPADAVGHVVIEVISEHDKVELDKPDGIELHWIVNPQPARDN